MNFDPTHEFVQYNECHQKRKINNDTRDLGSDNFHPHFLIQIDKGAHKNVQALYSYLFFNHFKLI